jgi:hypothetical protein
MYSALCRTFGTGSCRVCGAVGAADGCSDQTLFVSGAVTETVNMLAYRDLYRDVKWRTHGHNCGLQFVYWQQYMPAIICGVFHRPCRKLQGSWYCSTISLFYRLSLIIEIKFKLFMRLERTCASRFADIFYAVVFWSGNRPSRQQWLDTLIAHWWRDHSRMSSVSEI